MINPELQLSDTDYIESMYKYLYDNRLDARGDAINGIDYIVAMTSWPGRINETYKSVISLLNQGSNFKILLCVSKKEFPSVDFLPSYLREVAAMCKFEIIFCDDNPKIFKKSLYARKLYPTLPILTVDDDLWYMNDFCEIMWSMYRAFDDRKHIITWGINHFNIRGEVFEGGVGYGCMYPPSVEFTEMFEKLLCKELYDTSLDDEYNAFIAKKLGFKYHYIIPRGDARPGVEMNHGYDSHSKQYWCNRLSDMREYMIDTFNAKYKAIYGE